MLTLNKMTEVFKNDWTDEIDKKTNLWIQEIERTLNFLKNEKAKSFQEMMLQHHFVFAGVNKKEWIKKLDYVLKEILECLNKHQKMIFCEIMLNKENRECHLFACEVVMRSKLIWKLKDLDWIISVFEKKLWWDIADNLDGLFGELLLTKNVDEKLAYRYLLNMLDHKNFWVKRIALQSQLDLQDNMHVDWVCEFAERFLTTDNFYLKRSVGWILRNARRVDMETVDEFISHHVINSIIMRTIFEH